MLPRIRRSPALLCIGLVVVATALLLRRFWSPGVFLAGHDTIAHDYMMWDWGWRATLALGRPPLWNPYLFGGWPFVASFAFCPYYPPAWLSLALPTSLALTTQYALHFALGAIGMYAFSRTLRLPPPVAIAAALWYLAGAHVATLAHPGHLAKVQAIAWLPWAMGAAARIAAQPRPRWALALGACWAMQLLASHAQIFYATAAASSLFAVAAVIGARCRPHSDKPSPPRMRRLGATALALVGAGALAAGLSAIQMLPAWDMARMSNRAGGLDRAQALHGAMPFEELAEIALPSFLSDSTGRLVFRWKGEAVALPYMGRWNADPRGRGAERVVSDYMGVWAVVLALAGALLSCRRAKWFFLAMALTVALVATGDATPLFALAYRWVPGFAMFRSPGTLFVLVHLAVMSLAALGMDALPSCLAQARRARWQVASVCGMLALGAVALLAACYWFVRRPLPQSVEGIENHAPTLRLMAQTLAFEHLATYVLAGSLVGGIAALLWGTKRRAGQLASRAAIVTFVAIGLLDGFSQIERFLPIDRTEAYEQYLRHHPIDSAIAARAQGEALPTVLEIGNELTCRPMMRALRSLHGYHPVILAPYARLVAEAGGFHSETLAALFAQNYRVGPASGDLAPGWRRLGPVGGKILDERQVKLPPAWLPQRIEAMPQPWDDLGRGKWTPYLDKAAASDGQLAYAEGCAWQSPHPTGSGVKRVHMTLDSPDHLLLRRAALFPPSRPPATEPQPCVVAVPAAPGWRARYVHVKQDGTTQPVSDWLENWPKRCNGYFLMAPISTESGVATELRYAPESHRWGRLATLLSLLAVALGTLWAQHSKKKA